jgi:NAD+ synthase (glutamine-hydrolysing)
MGTGQSRDISKQLAEALAENIGCVFHVVQMDTVVESFLSAFTQMTGKSLSGCLENPQESAAYHSVLARSRMVLGYLSAQLLLCTAQRREHVHSKWSGSLLVLGSSNLDEAYRGYYKKYDCSSADINPIGGIGKTLLYKFLEWAGRTRGLPALLDIVRVKPLVELNPEPAGDSETEEFMTFEELNTFARLRVDERCGPVSMYTKLRDLWPTRTPSEIAEKVKRFFRLYAINRHKVTTLPPSYHMESFSCDDNRYDQRQFLYNVEWPRQFASMDLVVTFETDMEERKRAGATSPQPSPKKAPEHFDPHRKEDEEEAVAFLRLRGFTVIGPTATK